MRSEAAHFRSVVKAGIHRRTASLVRLRCSLRVFTRFDSWSDCWISRMIQPNGVNGS